MHLRLTMILRVDARSATAQENTSHAVTRPRMVAELVVAFTDPGSFWYSGAAASLLLDGGICSGIEHSDPVNGVEIETTSGRVGAGEQRSISSDADAIAAVSVLSRGSKGRALEEWERLVRQYEAQNLDAPGHNQSSNTGAQPKGFRVVQICQTERDETAEA